jgi:hypothetical protein
MISTASKIWHFMNIWAQISSKSIWKRFFKMKAIKVEQLIMDLQLIMVPFTPEDFGSQTAFVSGSE